MSLWDNEQGEIMRLKIILVAMVLVALAVIAPNGNATLALAKPADTYTIDWYTIDGGGTMSATGGSYTLSGTIGQPDAGIESGGNYKLNGGFWGFLDSLSKLNLPLIVR